MTTAQWTYRPTGQPISVGLPCKGPLGSGYHHTSLGRVHNSLLRAAGDDTPQTCRGCGAYVSPSAPTRWCRSCVDCTEWEDEDLDDI
jgi:hypothetical protein